MSQLPKPQVDQLQAFISLLKATPQILHDPALSFFRDYLESMGATLPTPPPKKERQRSKSPEPEEITPNKTEEMEVQEDVEVDVEEEDPESDVELDMTGVIGKWNVMPETKHKNVIIQIVALLFVNVQ